MKVRVLSPALDEIVQAALWFDSKRTGLGGEYWRDVDSVFARIEANPLEFAQSEFATAESDIRFALVHRFNYVIHFVMNRQRFKSFRSRMLPENPDIGSEALGSNHRYGHLQATAIRRAAHARRTSAVPGSEP